MIVMMTLTVALAGKSDGSSSNMTYGEYERVVDKAISLMLQNPQEPTGQLDIGHTHVMLGPDRVGDIWTRLVEAGVYQEQWFLDSSYLTDSFDSGWRFEGQGKVEWPEMESILTDQSGYLQDTYIDMEVAYVDVPEPAVTQGMIFDGLQVERAHFIATQDGEPMGRMLREVHTSNTGVEKRFDYWLFKKGYTRLGAGDSLDLAPAAPMNPAVFFALAEDEYFQGGAVVEHYLPTVVDQTCVLGGPGC